MHFQGLPPEKKLTAQEEREDFAQQLARRGAVKPKTVIPRERADRDVNQAIDFYLGENAPKAALGFIDALEQAYGHIGRHSRDWLVTLCQ